MKVIVDKAAVELLIGVVESEPMDCIKVPGLLLTFSCPFGTACAIRPLGCVDWFYFRSTGPFIMDEEYVGSIMNEVDYAMGQDTWERLTVYRDDPEFTKA